MKKIKHYTALYDYHYNRQDGTCSGCGGLLCTAGQKIDLAHWLPRTEKNEKNCPLFINSALNTSLQHNGCNVGRLLPYYKRVPFIKNENCKITHYIAERYEAFLRRHPAIATWANNPIGRLWEGKCQ